MRHTCGSSNIWRAWPTSLRLWLARYPFVSTPKQNGRRESSVASKHGAGLAGFETRPLLIVCFFLDTPEPLSQNPASFPGSRAGIPGILTWGYRAVLARLDRTMHQPRLRGARLVAAR